MTNVLAAADIGSNTAHLLVASYGPSGLGRLLNESEWLSLGQVVSHENRIPKELISRLTTTLKAFKSQSASLKADGIYVFATEAVRKAENHRDVLKIIKKETGLDVDIIEPKREAELGLKGALIDCHSDGRFVLAETGGGSVQVAVCEGADILSETSAPIGTGVLIDRALLHQPATTRQVGAAEALIGDALSAVPSDVDVKRLVASGGVARGLWRALHPDGDPTIHLEELKFMAWVAKRLNQTTIGKRYSVKAKRAATLLPGSLVYKALMEKFNLSEMTVSQFGVREGAILEMSQGKILPCQL